MNLYKEVYKKFALSEGSKHIATEFAMMGIEKLIYQNKIKSVFEFGIGIGTLPYLVKKINPEITYVGTESNDYCIKLFKENLGELVKDEKFIHLNNGADIPNNMQFDLIIIDGIFEDIDLIKKMAKDTSIIFIEGIRKDQKDNLVLNFPKALVSRCISMKKNYDWSPHPSHCFMKGYTIIRLDGGSLLNKFYFIKEKIETSLKYRIRNLLEKFNLI